MISPDPIRTAEDSFRALIVAYRDVYFELLQESTLAVLIGVVLEIPEVLHEIWDNLFPANLVRPIKIISSVGLFLVILGIAGELTFEGRVSEYDGKLQTFDEFVLGEAKLAAAEAQQNANEAARQAGLLGVKVDSLPSFVSQKETEITGELDRFQKYEKGVQNETGTALDKLRTNTEALNKATEDAKAAAKEAEAQRKAMAEANAPRYLLPQQQIDFVNTLKGFGKLNIQLVTPPNTTPDVGPLASLLEVLIKQPKGNNASIMQPLGGWAKYVQVCPGPTPTPNINAAAAAIVNALNADKVPAFIMPNCDPKAQQYGAGDPIKDADIIVYVGSKF
ncbi:MAG: hypothetical protein ABSF53_17410 [Terracidiphilus sp.]|jgi:hypothetical protein